VQVPSGVAVLGKDFWSAKKGRDALTVGWDESAAFKLSSGAIMAEYKQLATTSGLSARKDGDADKELGSAAKTFEAGFEFPYLAHATMEPMNCVIQLGKDKCEVWNGEQFQTVDQASVAAVLGLKPEQVKLNQLYAGGSFGRRANPHSDYLVEAAHIVKAIGGRVPVKLVWTREDDMKAGYYRPMYYHTIKAGLDTEGKPVAWQQRIVGQSILRAPLSRARWSRTASTSPRSKGRPTCHTRSRISRSNCTPPTRPSAFRCNGGARWVRRTAPFRPKCSWTNWPLPRARTQWNIAVRCSPSTRATSPSWNWRCRRRGGERRLAPAKPASGAAAASPCTNRSIPLWRRLRR
jgi:isoquinoline 1-oxidoreductase beta subunit